VVHQDTVVAEVVAVAEEAVVVDTPLPDHLQARQAEVVVEVDQAVSLVGSPKSQLLLQEIP
jgi:hypothetical protein